MDGDDPVMSRRGRWLVAAPLLAGAALWLVARSREPDGGRLPSSRQEAPREEPPREEAPREEPPREEAPREEPPREEPPRNAPGEPPALAGNSEVGAELADLPVIGPSPDDRHDGAAHPHPITPRHLEIQHENGMIALLNDALSARDGARMRELVREYRRAHPEGSSQLQDGYEIIADCLEAPGDASRAAAARYYAERRASTVRRFVRTICLEGS